jgi:hypothetical protein
VTLDCIQPGELVTDQYRLEVGLQTTAVHVAFIKHLQMLRLQDGQSRLDSLLHGHICLH